MSIKKLVNENVWSQAYRPQKLEDVILPDDLREEMKALVEKDLLHTIFSGRPGIGKTTLAKVIINEIDADYLFLNGSAERGIDVIRNKITNYCASSSLDGKKKIVLFDEADQLTQDAQLALRAVMEDFSSNVTFFMTANFPDRIGDALKSRCQEIRFDFTKNKVDTMKQMAKRSAMILKNESVEFEKDALIAIVKAKFPDMRSIINSLQTYGSKGKIDSSIIDRVKTTSIDGLFEILRQKRFKDMTKWVLENVNDPVQFVAEMWYIGEEKIEQKSLPYYAVFLDDLQDRLTRVPDKLLSIIATLTKTMADCEVIKE
ncbi:clamp loader subunit DNA polymerase accessory protein [Rhizobium phage RHph_I46]|uniref:Sliding-clamp-loader large subunit n=1 Tax=Rhizobium phage RHph_I1_9 TaxID=2509729 RepID=A0A7S5UXP7_9CAUD|nr:clamp loader subunit DNA polymerase accessory protein [Rhizobium phage RHph_I1_9]QIG69726.1 clamp loader subunit DNA polymerase accessory protein [Rhizobium phage RHph_I46]QIG71007.1 clamp loader subunit DNA polymerase accessory protein [Rhizobium phage RHph_I9]QIG73593.1 clamp loader subunit DNA polymerase accessory protein [Rhizobium phage RHph_I1_9]QIG76346.1 clamp loader subunit DNA polymerase accessory protein [Rhizobium phage RHph_I34]